MAVTNYSIVDVFACTFEINYKYVLGHTKENSQASASCLLQTICQLKTISYIQPIDIGRIDFPLKCKLFSRHIWQTQ